MVTANDSAFSLSVSLGDGRGGFSSHVDYIAGLFPDSVVAVDLNLDGKLDLVSANSGQDTVTVIDVLPNGNLVIEGVRLAEEALKEREKAA